MTPESIAAWYAAGLSTLLVVVQFAKWWRTRVSVTASVRDLLSFRGDQPVKHGVEYLMVEFVNHFDHQVVLSTVSLVPVMEGANAAAVMGWDAVGHRVLPWKLPLHVAPHQRESVTLPWSDIRARSALQQGFRIEIETTTGQRSRSRVILPSETSCGVLVLT
jgi:hypothetical protein